MSDTSPLVDHLERHLRAIGRGWRGDVGLQVVEFPDAPEPGLLSFATLGLSAHLLTGTSGRDHRMELVTTLHSCPSAREAGVRLLDVAEEMVRCHRPLLRGEVFGPCGPLVAGASVEAFYSTIPMHLVDEFFEFTGTTPPTVFPWLIPVTRAEADLVKGEGWSAFEDLLEATDPDLFDLFRPSLA